MTTQYSVLALLLLLGASQVAASDERSAAVVRADALEEQYKFQEIIDTLRPFENDDDAGIEFRLAHAYLNLAIDGRKVGTVEARDIAPAISFAERAARHGSGGASNLLYLIHANGYGVSVDVAKATSHLLQAVEAGDTGAKINYAVSLYLGTPGVAKDRDKACALFGELLKVDNADAIASYYVGLATFLGQCGKVADRKKGVELIRFAAEHGVREAERDMGKNFEFGWTEQPDLVRALEWYEAAAEHGDPHSQWRIGMAYVEGRSWPKDSRLAVESFEHAVASGDSNAMTSLAVMYATGDGVEQSHEKALSLYRQAAELGNAHAYRGMAVMHLAGQGVAADPASAYELYKKAIELGDPEDPALRQALEAAVERGVEQGAP